MPIISVRDNEDNRWKRNAKENQKKKKNPTTENNKEGGRETEAKVKGWELNDFVVLLS